ncbi:General alpha-glucoside permease [Cercospora beticola]|uniref:General alpha-glucoside permease n=1 Tax=Cercospora beticola TaxID=122368 RepID=A0A2G5HMP0_CERBT|nr:General alpha-glucoside permease [Cercospora beticola]PIA93795.1 General alpha-glucoside permease [Cercospora beticola]WPB01568.1 hypothetical protein RHO25_006196 [Cercospora beticola]CAK1363638.1 unnamed protein product [Cercospora beticola]
MLVDEKNNSSAMHVESLEDKQHVEVAQDAAAAEHSQTFWQAIKSEPKAVLWSVAVSTAIIMEGYDIVLVTSLFGQPAFAERYGSYVASSTTGKWQIPAPWQSALGAAPTIGAVAGAFLNGWLTHKFGYRKVLLASLVAITAFIFLLFFATNLTMLLVGLVLCGLPWGVFATMAPAYASEVCSLTLRGYMTVYVNLCWAFGQLIAAGVLEGFATSTSQWAYRVPFALQWIFPVPLFLLIWFCPESPWWLVRRGRTEEAAHALRRLASKSSTTPPEDTIALIKHTNQLEDEVQSGTSYWSCFKGVDLRRTEIVCMAFAAQIWCGSPLGGSPTYFFLQAGVPTSTAFKFSVGGLGLASLGTIISWFLLSRIGRRTLYVWGMALLTGCLLITGIVAATFQGSTSSYIQAGFVMAWLLIYYLTVGPVCYAIISETSAVRLRNKSVCLSRISYYICQVIGNVIQPYMVNPGNENWQGKSALFWAGTSAIFFVWTYFRLPETKDRSYEELNILFQEGFSARKFSKVIVDPYAERSERIKQE